MRRVCWLLTCLAGFGGLMGCGETPVPQQGGVSEGTPAVQVDGEKSVDPHQAVIDEAIAKLPPEEQAAAREQGYCVVSEEPLGSMGAPVKVAVGDKSVWICCKGCKDLVDAKPDAMVLKADELKKRVATEKTAIN